MTLSRTFLWASVLAWAVFLTYNSVKAQEVREDPFEPLNMQAAALGLLVVITCVSATATIVETIHRKIADTNARVSRLIAQMEEYGQRREAHGHSIAMRAIEGDTHPGAKRGRIYPINPAQ